MIKKITPWIIIIVFLILVLWDLYAWAFGGEGATISRVYLNWQVDRPWLIAGLCYLMGHLTWPQKIYIKVDADGKVIEEVKKP